MTPSSCAVLPSINLDWDFSKFGEGGPLGCCHHGHADFVRAVAHKFVFTY